MPQQLSLPKSRFERTDDVARQGSDAQLRLRRDFHRQYAATPIRCQRTTVSGLTMVTASRMRPGA
jgi:hypothetical protein